MELEDLKKQMESLETKLDASVRLNRRVLDERVLDKAGRAMTRLGWTLGAELAFGLVAVLLTGSFVADHVSDARFLVPGLALHVFVIAQIGILVRQLVKTRDLDYAAPLVEIQRRLETLEVSLIRATLWTLLLAPLLWTPLFIVALKGLLDVDAYDALGVRYIVANIVLGLAVIAAGLLVSRRYANRIQGSPRAMRLMRTLAGTNLAAARAFLESLSRFEKDDSIS